MRLFIALLVCMILLGGMGSAEISKLEAVKLNQPINLVQIEFNSTYQNLTFILTPNKTIIPINLYMTKNGYSYNYTFQQTNETGIYTANGCSDISCWNYEFEVTSTGNYQTTYQGINSFGFLFLMISLNVIFGIVGFKLYSHDKLWILGFMFLFLSLLFLVYNLWLSYEFATNAIGTNNGDMTQIFFMLFLISITAGFFMYLVMILKNWKDIKNSFMKALTDKDPDDDGWDGGSYNQLDLNK